MFSENTSSPLYSPLSRYGSEFVHEAYLYHVTRRDIKHNFSPYFYLLYLIQGTSLSLPVGLLAFLPQVGLLLAAAISLHRDIVFCCFVQTFVFVTFNKVCTSQVYYIDIMCIPYKGELRVDLLCWT